QLDRLRRYREWLADEGVRSGGIGPGEVQRLERRHLADSLLFAGVMPRRDGDVVDLGTGLGLPGVPLAIAMPDRKFTLVDRSQRRVDLLRRVGRMLDLENCQTIQGEIEDLDDHVGVLVSRASLPPPALIPIAHRLLRPGGTAVVGGSWQTRPEYEGWETVEIPRHVLDHPIWLLMMRQA
ncbi:MAG: class I SAM-dependent methyltransferase, partial [Acidimicrobiia bacterium]